MLDHLNTVPDLQFFLIFFLILAGAYVAEWAFSRWANGGKRGDRPQ